MHPTHDLPPHLGGHCNITHVDKTTLSYLMGKFSIKTMYDIGCGPGGMLDVAREFGIIAVGIDGDYTIKYPSTLSVITHDFTRSQLDLPNADLGWSCEFLEHVEEKYSDNYFSVFKKCRVVCCTFSTSFGGHHHVNVKDQKYWDETFKRYGFSKHVESTNIIRRISNMKRDFVRNTGTVYINEQKR